MNPDVTMRGVTARKAHRCVTCRRMAIQPGHRYLRIVHFPDGVVNQTRHPFVARWCLACALDRAEEVGTLCDDPIVLTGACGSYCHGVDVCPLPGDHEGEHTCRQDW